MSGATLVTGADGYVGRRVVAQMLDRGQEVVLAVRANDAAELARKRAALAGTLAGREAQATVVPADVRDPEPFAAVDPARITGVVHAASVVRFNVDESTARTVNVDGARKLRHFAARCPRLGQFVLLSTIYSTGRATGVVAEQPHEGAAGFVNNYEWSKWAAEAGALAGEPDLPTAIVRIATIAADDASGAVTQLNAFHHTLRLFYYGLLSLVPGDRSTPVYLVTGDVVGDVIGQLAASRATGIFHASPDRACACTLQELVDIAFGVFAEDDDFRRRRILAPLYCDRDSFDALLQGTRSLGSSALGQTLDSVSPFVEQLYLGKDVRNDRLTAACPAIEFPPPAEFARAVTRWLTATRWNRRQEVAA